MSGYPSTGDNAALARLASQIDALRAEVIPRLDRIENQVLRTNGRVNKHDVQLAVLEEHDSAQEKTDAAVSEANDRWFRRFAWGVGIALTVILTALGWLIVNLAP